MPHYTVADYNRWEGDWELLDGVAISMGPSPFMPHSDLLGRIYFEFEVSLRKLKHRQFRALIELDWIVDNSTVVRPDLVIVKEPVDRKHLMASPVLVAEILSESTREKDETWKFDLYRKQGVRYYLLADPDSQIIQVHRLVEDRYQPEKMLNRHSFELSPECTIKVDLGRALQAE